MREEFIGQCTAIANEPLDAGAPLVIVGYTRRYAGELMKPRTWFKFNKFAVVESTRKRNDSI